MTGPVLLKSRIWFKLLSMSVVTAKIGSTAYVMTCCYILTLSMIFVCIPEALVLIQMHNAQLLHVMHIINSQICTTNIPNFIAQYYGRGKKKNKGGGG